MDAPNDKYLPARILWLHRWSSRLLSFRLSREPGFRFVPGQFARLGLRQANGVPVWRAYSMASATWGRAPGVLLDHRAGWRLYVPS